MLSPSTGLDAFGKPIEFQFNDKIYFILPLKQFNGGYKFVVLDCQESILIDPGKDYGADKGLDASNASEDLAVKTAKEFIMGHGVIKV
ncbi:hypothetical protein [Acaryochloris marina]|uniref:hypothetical protein n=1 Tax=Acaryochloris marina TaxID=155978 RepID=UPI001BB0C347|nr:hypothetical protein [Acaryochloris marina]QUY46022.1 hypothetical protein I1H34_30340 [Acaryochloris marina S15]